MSKNLEKKTKKVRIIKKLLKDAVSVFIADYRGISNNHMNDLRIICKEEKISLQIQKNTVFKIAFNNTQYSSLKKFFVGPTIVAFSVGNRPSSIVKIFRNFMKENSSFSIRSGMIGEDTVVEGEVMSKLESIRCREEAFLKFSMVVREISILKFLRLLKKIVSI
ncbi:50S ribosomal protein L10 [Candidatus Riesia pediculischaeffi]|uniref:Large ribosomal subunit protein uL10 n=1 Tax=Candidatus Riesia pediculischaeffi TaxID=428411 RepID=A0A1V0HK96_9ENTR|nr:50S ribosomal protein L10 [Candidatus Riesia pediculischaeffi]ARC53243.1 hypothetical protein AOQ87_00855 [Candidatus Riesia pediculischaeffi]